MCDCGAPVGISPMTFCFAGSTIFTCVAYLGGYVQQAIRAKFSAVRTNWSYLNRARNLALGNVDHINRGAIRTWFSHAGISINGDVDEARIGRDGSFMTVYADGNGRESAA